MMPGGRWCAHWLSVGNCSLSFVEGEHERGGSIGRRVLTLRAMFMYRKEKGWVFRRA
jgi:hypothetical protein